MTLTERLPKIFQTDWFIALFLLAAFLATNGYTYAWDDQHLEIPLLKSLIDPHLYPGDYYVDSLKQNFTSLLYPLLAKVITVEQVPAAYFILYLISRYFLFYWVYKIWRLLSLRRMTAVFCTLSIIVVGRVEEFLYRTFSHQEFALAIIFAGIYFFYRERYLLAAAILGIAANFHALYSLFPFIYMCVYLLMSVRKTGLRVLILSAGTFTFFCLPFLIWTVRNHLSAAPPTENLYDNWVALYKLACPQNFTFLEVPFEEMLKNFQTFLRGAQNYLPLLSFYLLNLAHNPKFRQDLKSQTSVLTGFAFLCVSFIFSYIIPNHFVLDLNLVRHAQFIFFILMGYTMILIADTVERREWLNALGLVMLLPLIRFGHDVAALVGLFMLFWIGCNRSAQRTEREAPWVMLLSCAALAFCGFLLFKVFGTRPFSHGSIRSVGIIAGVVVAVYVLHFFLTGERTQKWLAAMYLVIPFTIFTVNYTQYHRHRIEVEQHGGGFWQLQRNWIDMQNYVKAHTEKNARLLVPHDMEMGGFRIGSERSVVLCYRDCGIIGFDYAAAVEWHRRLGEIEPFKVFVDSSVNDALRLAIQKYRANYIVFMGYMDPGENQILEPVYHNEVFALYRVKVNPVQ